ncbi:MAG: biotin--[acetyl-CoA-carboxylase] ligase [Firmicutes bacterium]|nr:biotin--[acetyl-CoA-carboxylase] ligase [Bacillota bacterium]
MKIRILEILKSTPDWVSGETLRRAMGVSRTAVWKHIRTLREEGYNIEARPNLGYRLLQAPDAPLPGEVITGLSTAFIGRRLEYVPELSSTNELATRLARDGCPAGTVVVTETQTGGKGRLGRAWFSPRDKGLWFTVVLRPPVNPAETPQLTMVAAVAVATAVRDHTGVPADIKWPNDILVRERKLCGILVELNAEMDRVNFMVAGMGLNVNVARREFPPEIRSAATSLLAESGEYIPRVPLFRALLKSFEDWYCLWLDQGFAPILRRWRELCITLDCPVTVHTLRESYSGYAVDVDDTGALLVRTASGRIERLLAGEVSLRKS